MKRSSIAAKTWFCLVLSVTWPVLAVASPPVLTEYGMQYESARVAALAGDHASLDILAKTLAAEDFHDSAALDLLWGEIHFAQGLYVESEEDFHRGEKATGDDDLKASAAYRRAEAKAALLASNDNAGAEKIWRDWLRHYPHSPLVTEGQLRLIWVSLRAGRIDQARADLTDLGQHHPWLTETSLYRYAKATVAFVSADYAASLALVEGNLEGPGPIFLAALNHSKLGHQLPAAAAFQRVADTYPGSSLRDYALFAKANTFLNSRAYRSAAEGFAYTAQVARNAEVRAEAELRQGAAVYLDGDVKQAASLLREVIIVHSDTDVAARAQFLLGEVMMAAHDYPAAIVEYTRVLSNYFDQDIAASAQYRLGRCYDAMDQFADATASYMAVVSGYPAEPEAVAAAYMTGASLLDAGDPRGAVPYLQLVLDRYSRRTEGTGMITYTSPAQQEIAEAALCLLEVAWYRVGDLGQLTGAPHAILQSSPPSNSFWRAWTELIDADAMASQGNYAQTRDILESLRERFPVHPALTPVNQLLAWTYAQLGQEDMAIITSEKMLARDVGDGDSRPYSEALLNVAHVRFNQARYQEAVAAYEKFARRYPEHSQTPLALYQAGLCYLSLGRSGDAVDRWEAVVRADPDAPLAEKAWARAGDVYFQADRYAEAKRCYSGLLEHFGHTRAAALGMLRVAQSDYNTGNDTLAILGYEAVIKRFPDSDLKTDANEGIEVALYRLGQQPGGVAQLKTLLQKYPRGSFAPDAQFQIAARLYEQKEFEAAADEYRRVVSQYPGYSAADRAQFLMAESLELAAKDGPARLAYEQLLDFFADSELRVPARFRLATSKFNAGEYRTAATEFTAVLAAHPEPDLAKAAVFNLGLCSRSLADLEQAIIYFTRYQEQFPDDVRTAEVSFQLGDTYDRAGRLAEAVAAFRTAARAHPEPALHAQIYYRMGGCFEKQENRKKAIEAYTLAARTPLDDDVYRLSSVARCAVLLEDTQQYERALASYRDLMANSSDSDLAAAAGDRAAEIAAALE